MIANDCGTVNSRATLFVMTSWTNKDIARLLRQVAAAYTVTGESFFRTAAYERAAETIENSTLEVKDLWEERKLSGIPGIGASLSSHLDELFRTGSVKHFESVLKKLPQGMFALLDIPGFGPKKAFKLASIFKLEVAETAVVNLLKAAEQGKIAKLEGFGTKSQEDIIAAIGRFLGGQDKESRMPLPYASEIAEQIILYLKKLPEVTEAVPLGSLRRQVATIGDIDIAVSTQAPEKVLNWFINFPKKRELVEKGPAGATIRLSSGKQVDLRVQTPDKFGTMLQYFTGSKNHNIHLREVALKKGLSLNEYGIKTIKTQNIKHKTGKYNTKEGIYEFDTEDGFYKAVGLPWIPPELREDRGEIEAAQNNKLPELIELTDIKGEFHVHSNYNLSPSHDLGSSSLTDIVQQSKKLGYEYIGISDHNPSVSNHNKNDIISILSRRKETFEQIMQSIKNTRVHLLIMLETDILPDGKLSIPDEASEYLDAFIVSIHSSFTIDRESMTRRILSGLSHPKAKILAHPTGRLIGSRESIEADWSRIFEFCREHDKALEINAFPQRLDLPDELVREAIGKKVKLVIDTDSHDASQMNLMRYGISVARRGWARPDDILNTLPYNTVYKWLTGN
jgi:DNA polymerase (family X)